MNDITVKTYVSCKTEKRIEDFYYKDSECKTCNIKKVLKRYYNNKKIILQKRRDKYARLENLDNRFEEL